MAQDEKPSEKPPELTDTDLGAVSGGASFRDRIGHRLGSAGSGDIMSVLFEYQKMAGKEAREDKKKP